MKLKQKKHLPFIGAGQLFSATRRKELSELHDCPKCHGKMVAISIDLLGVTRCGYCHEVVDYDSFAKEEMEEPRVKKFLEKLKEDRERKKMSRAKKKKYHRRRE